MTKLSIIVPLYHESRKTIEKSMEAMMNLQYPDKEIIFVFEPEELQLAKLVSKPGFKAVITNGGSKSKAKALNEGFKYSTGDIIAFYDADTKPEPEQALKAVQALECGYDIVTGYIIASTDTFLQKMRAIDLLDHCSLITVKPMKILFGYSLYMKREVMNDLGGWDDDTVSEDLDFSIKVNLRGYKCGIINSPVYAESSKGFKNIIMQKSRWIKGEYQVISKWRGKVSSLPFSKKIDFTIAYINRYMALVSFPLFLLTFYCIYLLSIGKNVLYLWVLPFIFLVEFILTLIVITRRQLVKLKGVSFIHYLLYPIYHWVILGLVVWVGFLDWRIRPKYWYRVMRE